MKKRIFAIAFVISVIIGLSACKNPPIFAAIEQEVKLNPASVKGFVCGIVEINGTLYASNGKIWYKAKGETGKWSELSGCPSGRCTGLAVSGSDLYAAFGQGDTFTIYWYDTGAKSWTEVSGLTAKAVFGTRVVFAIDSRTSGNTTTYTISSAIESGTPNTWASPTDKAPVGAAGLYCLLEDGLYNNTGTKVIGTDSPSSGLKGICEGPTDSVFVVDNTKLYCYDGNTSTWTNIVHGVSSPQSITYLPSKQLVLISGIKGYGEIKLASATDTNLANAHTVSAGSADSSVPSANIHQYNNSVGKHTINPIYALDYGTGYIIYVGVNDPNAKYTGLWGFYSFGKKNGTVSNDLFETAAAAERLPLAARMRPRSLDEYIGQEHIVGKGRLLRRAIQADRLSSVIFFGPPGTGKTTLAQVIANHTKSNFLSLNAVLAGVQQIRDAIASAEQYKKLYGKPTILFVDEVHRWNRAQQDALLPWVENGTIIFIGATTENPFFEVNKALVSRSRVFQLKALTDADLYRTVERCLQDTERGYGKWKVSFTEGALEHLVETAAGDARSLLNALELAVETSVDNWPPPAGTEITIGMQAAEESIQQKAVLYDKDGDYHYDIISAFIKSIRGSDPDAALYWLARMVRAGESPHFIFRRMLISACEDIGLADPLALTVVTSAAAAFDRIGLPEGRYHLTHAALYLATCPKSNSSLGFFDALKAVEKEQTEVPNHLKDANRDGESLGHGEGYLYPHAYRDHWIAQQYLPDELIGRVFYTPGYTGYEEKIRNEVLAKRETQLAAIHEAAEGKKDAFTVEDWQARTEGSSAEILEQIRDTIIGLANLSVDDRVLVYRADGGLLLWPSTRITLNGCTAGIFEYPEALHSAQRYAETFEFLNRPIMTVLPVCTHPSEKTPAATQLDEKAAPPSDSKALFPELAFDVVLSYNPAATADGFTAFFSRVAQEHTAGARIIFAFALPQQGLRLSALLPTDESVNRFSAAEAAFFSDSRNTRTAWTENTVADIAEKAGYRVQLLKKVDYKEKRLITQAELGRWFSIESEYGTAIRSAFVSEEGALKKSFSSWNSGVENLPCIPAPSYT